MRQKSNGRQRQAAGNSTIDEFDAELTRLATLPIAQLREAWTLRFAINPPLVRSRDILVRMMAWKIQVEVAGGLDVKTEHRLRVIAAALDRDATYEPLTKPVLSPGIELTREWKGVVHKAAVTRDGFRYLGKHYGSLSDIARTITGTRWSGPRFFGLESKGAGAARSPSS